MTAAEPQLTESVCPYLGLPDDPRSHFTFPDRAHRCWAKKKPADIDPGYQASFCLGESHTACERFRSAERPLPAPARLLTVSRAVAPDVAATAAATTPLSLREPTPVVVPTTQPARRQAAPKRSSGLRRTTRRLARLIGGLLVLAVIALLIVVGIAYLTRPQSAPAAIAMATDTPPVAAVVTASPALPPPVTARPSVDVSPIASLESTPSAAPSPPPATSTPLPSPNASVTPFPSASIEPFPSPTPFLYTVQPGDTLISIARKFHIDPHTLQKANKIKNPSLIFAGDQLIIPIDPSQYPDITPEPTLTPHP